MDQHTGMGEVEIAQYTHGLTDFLQFSIFHFPWTILAFIAVVIVIVVMTWWNHGR